MTAKTLLFRRCGILILFCASAAMGQQQRPDFNRSHDFDVQHYIVRAGFDRVNRVVMGDTTVILTPTREDFRVLQLDAVGLEFRSVTLDPSGIPLKFVSHPAKVVITLDKPYGPRDTISVRFRYTATKPVKGVYFRDADEDHSAQIWSQGEAEEARYWIPSFDFPSDKATSEEYLTSNKDEVVVGNGELIGKADNPDGTVTWHYKMPVPHSTYLLSFVMGKYSRIDDRYKDIPLGYYVYPGREAVARKAFGGTPKMIAAFEALTGVPFPYNKYDQTVVSQFQFGGMENITATTMADSEIFFADFEFGKNVVTDLVSHELAHSWFGDLVTCKNWAELWLNEGFATYMEAAYREAAFGHDDYVKKIKSDAGEFLVDEASNKKPYGLFNRQAGNVDALFDNSAITYNKGGVVLYMLREQVGRENFWKALNSYLNKYRFSNVESTDLRKVMEETSGQDLGWFFDQWVYDVGAPHLSVAQSFSPGTKTVTMTVTQTQPMSALSPSAYRLPISVLIKTPDGNTTEKLDITKRSQIFHFKVAAKPSEIVLDPDFLVPIKVVKMGRMLVTR